MTQTFDFAVIGAGCFGAWTAHELLQAGHRVLLLDAFGAAHARASSGGESRVIRMGYGADELYTRWSLRSLHGWQALAERTQRPLFRPCGMLWLAGPGDRYVRQTQQTLARIGVEHAQLSPADLAARFAQFSAADVEWALWEPGSGALLARQAVQALVAADEGAGLVLRCAAIAPPRASDASGDMLARVVTLSGDAISAGAFVFSGGAWLPKLFPDLLGPRIFPTRQEVFFFAPPPGNRVFGPPAMPCWFHHPALVYGIPDLEGRGVKISIDRHGEAFDPDSGPRLPRSEGLAPARAFLAQRFPALADAPLTESRVCQYENTSNGDFILDRHPAWRNVYIAGGGSGHGFKHGPAVGAYVSRLATTAMPQEPRFALAAKATTQARDVF